MRVDNISCSHSNYELLRQLTPIDSNLFEFTEVVEVTLTLHRDGQPLGRGVVSILIRMGQAFKTDLASDPGNILKRVGVNERDFALAWCVHDKLNAWNVVLKAGTHETLKLNRKECDYILRELLRWQGMNHDLSHFVYKVLRNWGWVAWIRWRLYNMWRGLGV